MSVRKILLLGWLEFGIVLAFITLSNEDCGIDITPSGRKALIVNEGLNITCTASECNTTSYYIQFHAKIGGGSKTLSQQVCFECSLIINATMNINGAFLECAFIDTINPNETKLSETLEILVQSQLGPISDLVVSRLSVAVLNISWSPVLIYDELLGLLSYNVCFNDETYYNTTSNTWTTFNTTDLDLVQCDTINLSITPFIAASDQTLVGNTSQWNITYYNNMLINRHTIIMYENGTVLITIVIDTCSCEKPVSSHVTLKNKANFFSVTLPVTPVSNCSGNASLMLPPYVSIEVEVWLNYSNGLTMIQMENITFDSNPLKIEFINGTPPSIQCTFTNDVLISNHHLAGCLVYYANISHPAYALRDNDESSVTVNITDISSGYYNISVIPLTYPVQDLSVNISAQPIKPQPSTSTTIATSTIYTTITVFNATAVCSPTPSTSSKLREEEEDRRRRQEEEDQRRRQEEEDRRRRQEEEDRRLREEEEDRRRRQEEEDKRLREEEQDRRLRQEEEDTRLRQEEEDRRRLVEENGRQQEEEEDKRQQKLQEVEARAMVDTEKTQGVKGLMIRMTGVTFGMLGKKNELLIRSPRIDQLQDESMDSSFEMKDMSSSKMPETQSSCVSSGDDDFISYEDGPVQEKSHNQESLMVPNKLSTM
ncbi:PREDICTED: uncharacterized protein LOC100639376 [Amphimedon queenslandica]|uniref:Uncharacterized protein n=2 Tax=Amphimedon queenslandica TaxID=400682 RepID=A0AAN0JM50_AMPQE|nr:PREDICTED: uncharacterized protein LOC100639376 [Amphimedon queenslandica]|eukprot:XP_019857839.1 PREDICTED: uncharacterized protein LOC100639376 [Amphimedon queenslandica]